MAVKKKTTPRTTRRKRKPKSKKKSIWSSILIINFMILALSSGLFFLAKKNFKWPVTQGSDSRPVVESILLASGLKLGRDLETFVVKGDVHHWKVRIDANQRSGLLRSFKHLGEQEIFDIEIGEKKKIKGQTLQLITFSQNGKPVLKLILSIKQADKEVPYVPPEVEAPDKVTETYKSSAFWESYEGPKIAIIIDDVGIKPINAIRDLIDIQVPITFAVLPFQRFTTQCATSLHAEHYEVMLHMPMEPTNFPVTNPGAGAIFASFTSSKAKETLREALEQVPYAEGINNHMGSRVTASKPLMLSVMETLREQKLFFVDSRTHASTVAFDIALAENVPTAKRDVFLDATMSYEFTKKQLEETAALAQSNGFAVAIGHPYPSTIAALSDSLPALKARGFSFVFASEILQGAGN